MRALPVLMLLLACGPAMTPADAPPQAAVDAPVLMTHLHGFETPVERFYDPQVGVTCYVLYGSGYAALTMACVRGYVENPNR